MNLVDTHLISLLMGKFSANLFSLLAEVSTFLDCLISSYISWINVIDNVNNHLLQLCDVNCPEIWVIESTKKVLWRALLYAPVHARGGPAHSPYPRALCPASPAAAWISAHKAAH